MSGLIFAILEIEVNNFKSILTNISQTKYDTLLNIDSLQRIIIDQNIQQETYTEMLDRQSDWFIMYVTILFAIISIFGFVISTKTVSDIKRKNSKENKRQKKIHDELFNELNELKFKLYKALLNISVVNVQLMPDGKTEEAFLEFIEVFDNIRVTLDIKPSYDPDYTTTKYLLTFFHSSLDGPKLVPILKQLLIKDNSANLRKVINIMQKYLTIKDQNIKDICVKILAHINKVASDK